MASFPVSIMRTPTSQSCGLPHLRLGHVAGIDEGTDLKLSATDSIRKAERGQYQYALFAGLNKTGSACGHVFENGASSLLIKYALHKCNSLGLSPMVSADAPASKLAESWQCFAMTFDDSRDELTGVSGDRWLDNPKSDGLISYAYMQEHYHRTPGIQPGEDADFPAAQFYNPPEDEPLR